VRLVIQVTIQWVTW